MQKNFDTSFQMMLKHEGGFVNHPKDPGGMTNLGVTKRAWEEWLGREVTEAEMRALTPEVVKPFYKRRYWDACKCDDLPAGVDHVVFDIAVNSGPGRSARFLQEAAGVTVDGAIGPRTIGAANAFGANPLINKLCDRRESFWRSLNTFPTFGRGWLARGKQVRAEALGML